MVMAQHSTRARMVQTGLELLQRQGYSETSWRTLVHEGGAPFGSIQHFFPGGKTQLVEEALVLFVEKLCSSFDEVLAHHQAPGPFFGAWLNFLAQEFEADRCALGCPIASVALDIVPRNQALTIACRTSFEEMIRHFEAGLRSLGVDDPGTWAMRTVVAVEGALIVGRAFASGEPLRDAGRALAERWANTNPRP